MLGAREVVELGLARALVELGLVGEAVQQQGQPPGKARRAPHAAQRHLGIALEVGVVAAVVRDQRARQVEDVGDRQVQALRAGRRHDVRRIAGEEQPAVAHRLGDEAAQRRDRFLDRRPGDDAIGDLGRKARLQLGPELVVRPVLDPGVERALDVVAAEHRVALRGEGEAARVTRVDDLLDGGVSESTPSQPKG